MDASITAAELKSALAGEQAAAGDRRAPRRPRFARRPTWPPARCGAIPPTVASWAKELPRAEQRGRLLRARPRGQPECGESPARRGNRRAVSWKAGSTRAGRPPAARSWPSRRKAPRAGSRASGRRSTASPARGWSQRFVDPEAEFLYVPNEGGAARGEREGGDAVRRAGRAFLARRRAVQLRCVPQDLPPARRPGARPARGHRARRRHGAPRSRAAGGRACSRFHWDCRATSRTTTRC